MPIHAAFPIKEQSTVVRLDIGAHRSVDTSKVSSMREIVHFRERKEPVYLKSTAIYLALISIFFGGLGLHRFYLGYIAEGIFELLGLGCLVAGVAICGYALLGSVLGLIVLGLLLILLWFGSGSCRLLTFLLSLSISCHRKKGYLQEGKLKRKSNAWDGTTTNPIKNGKEQAACPAYPSPSLRLLSHPQFRRVSLNTIN